MKISILNIHVANPGDMSFDKFYDLGEVEANNNIDLLKTAEYIKDIDAIIFEKIEITESLLKKCPKLKYIGLLSTGYNHVDIEACKRHGVTVCNVPSYSTKAVASCAFAHILEITNKVYKYDREVKAGKWNGSPDFCLITHPLTELKGKTLGIIGMGRIGYATAKIGEAFGMKILGYRRTPDYSLETENIKYGSLDEVLGSSDIISLHCPLTDDTSEIICSENILKMKDEVIIINTSRGGLVCEPDLESALNSGKVSFVGTDVTTVEPPVDSSLIHHERCIVTPHIGWAPFETRKRLIDTAFENLKAYVNGSPVNELT